MNEAKYIIDANVLSTKRVASMLKQPFFQKQCIVLDEIAYELRNTSIGQYLEQIKVPVTGHILTYLPLIVDDAISNKILETDKGNGDVLLIAYAMYVASNKNEDQTQFQFITETPVIVTEEKAIQAYCNKSNMEWLSLTEFIKVWDAAGQTKLL